MDRSWEWPLSAKERGLCLERMACENLGIEVETRQRMLGKSYSHHHCYCRNSMKP
jgi:hypothetical protein